MTETASEPVREAETMSHDAIVEGIRSICAPLPMCREYSERIIAALDAFLADRDRLAGEAERAKQGERHWAHQCERLCEPLALPDGTLMDEAVARAVTAATRAETYRAALEEAFVPLEVLRLQIDEKPYAELTADLQEQIVDAALAVFAALSDSKEEGNG